MLKMQSHLTMSTIKLRAAIFPFFFVSHDPVVLMEPGRSPMSALEGINWRSPRLIPGLFNLSKLIYLLFEINLKIVNICSVFI